MAEQHLFRVIFLNQGKIYEIYARQVNHGTLFGFIEVEGPLFGERTSVVVDPSEERLKAEFAGVSRFFVPLHAVVRIDEVEKQGTAKITAAEGGNITPFPTPIYSPRKE